MKVKERYYAAICFLVFGCMLLYIWRQPLTPGNMNIKDWIKLIILEIPLQLGIHYLTDKSADNTREEERQI